MADPKSVLVVRLSSLGDVLLTTPVFESLRAAWPGARLSVLTKAAFAPVFLHNPNVDEVLMFEERGLWGWAAEIRRRRFDVFVDLHDTPRSRLWGWLSGAGRSVRYDKRTFARRRLVRTKEAAPSLSGRVVDRYLEALAPLGVRSAGRIPRVHLSPREELSPALSSRLGTGPFIAVAPGAAHATKRWPPERFAAAAGKLGSFTVLILGAPGDRVAAAAVAAALSGPSLNLAGETSLRETFLLLSRCRLLLTNDSGAMHAAAALGVPVAAVFGPTVEAFGFFPSGDRTAVVQVEGLACRPCHLHGAEACPLGHFRCMLDLPAERVAEAARKLL
jgi:heptosyltransferase-2